MTDATPVNVIEARGVTKEYSDNGVPVRAVRGIDLIDHKRRVHRDRRTIRVG